MKYAYPAVFRQEEQGFSIFFPDIRMGATQGDDIPDGLEMAHDFLVGAMIHLEDSGAPIPQPSGIADLELQNGEFASFVAVDTGAHRKRIGTKGVKKALSLSS